MNKQFFLLSFVVVAIATLAVSCQKETDTVTLGAEIQKPISGNSKVYIDDHTPSWHNGDMVEINDRGYPIIVAMGSSAMIENVEEHESGRYRAIYPNYLLDNGDNMIADNITDNSSFLVFLRPTQQFELVGDHQRVDVPMGAYLTSGHTLQFHNLCSIVRVIVSNSMNTALQLHGIKITAATAMLSGLGMATVNGLSTDIITMTSTARHDVGLSFADSCPGIVAARETRYFDIVVPAFSTDDVTITIYTSDGYFEITKEDVSLANNTITTVTINVTRLTTMAPAELVSGPIFRNIITAMYEDEELAWNRYIIVFETSSFIDDGILVSTADSPYPIYLTDDWDPISQTGIIRISTISTQINANPDCSLMFTKYGDEEMMRRYYGWGVPLDGIVDRGLVRIDFGTGFNTSNVTNMEGMFTYCRGLRFLDLSGFNTTNVINMSKMFAQCTGLTSLDLSSFITTNVTDMSAMFCDCRNLTSLNLSSFNTANVRDMGAKVAGSVWGDFISIQPLGMFANCYNLTSLDLSNFSTANVRDMCAMFSGCRGLRSLNLSSFNTSNVEDMGQMFYDCINLSSLDISSFDISNTCRLVAYRGDVEDGEYGEGWLDDYDWDFHFPFGSFPLGMCSSLSTNIGYCTITCSLPVENRIKEVNPYYDPMDEFSLYYISGLPTSGVTFTWVRP